MKSSREQAGRAASRGWQGPRLKPRREVLEARDEAAASVKGKIQDDRERAVSRSPKLAAALKWVDDHLYDDDLSVKNALAAVGANPNVAGSEGAGKYLEAGLYPPGAAKPYPKVDLQLYFRSAQIETALLIPKHLAFEAAAGEIGAAVGLPRCQTFSFWHEKVIGSRPVWPAIRRLGFDRLTWIRLILGKLSASDLENLLSDLSCADRALHRSLQSETEISSGPFGAASFGSIIKRAKAETRFGIQCDKLLLPQNLWPLLDCISKRIFRSLTAGEAVTKAEISDKKNVAKELSFHLGETVDAYIRMRWLEAATNVIGELPRGKSATLEVEISTALGRQEDTLYNWLKAAGTTTRDIARDSDIAHGQAALTYQTWTEAGRGEPCAIQKATDYLRINLEKLGVSTKGLSLGSDDSKSVAANIMRSTFSKLWRSPELINECFRSALAALQAQESDFLESGQLAYLAANTRWRRRSELAGHHEPDLAGLITVADLVLGLCLFSSKEIEEGAKHIKAALERLSGKALSGAGESMLDAGTRSWMREFSVEVQIVEKCLSLEVEEIEDRVQLVTVACDIFEVGLLIREDNPDQYRWALIEKANIARIAAKYTEAISILGQVDFTQPFNNLAISARVHWLAGVIYGETGEWRLALRTFDEAFAIADSAVAEDLKFRIQISKGGTLVHCGNREAFTVFRSCFVGSRLEISETVRPNFPTMVNMIISKYYFHLDAELPFEFFEFVEVAALSKRTKAWVPYCRALMESAPCAAHSLFLYASRDLEATGQILPAAIASLFAAIEAAKDGQISQASALAISAAGFFRANQAFGGKLALAAESFLASVTGELAGREECEKLLWKVAMPYRK